MSKLSGVVLVIRQPTFEAAQVLMVTNRNFGGWCMPGGKVEERDWENAFDLPPSAGITREHMGAFQGARRELQEETGLIAKGLVWLFAAPSIVEPDRTVHLYLAREVAGDVNRDAEPGTKASWFTWGDWPSGPFDPFYRRYFPNGIEHFKSTRRAP